MSRLVENFITDLRSDLADRADVDDEGQKRDTLWCDEDLLRYLNSAAARLASDTLALRHRFVIDTTVGGATYAFPYWRIIEILTASWYSPVYGRAGRKLRQFDIDGDIEREDYGEMIHVSPDLSTGGTPGWFTRDWDNAFMRLYPVPQEAGTLEVHAIVLPADLYPGMALPFQARQDYDLLLMWAKHMAYAKQDADTLDLTRSDSFKRQYDIAVRDRCSEIDRIRRDGGIMRPN